MRVQEARTAGPGGALRAFASCDSSLVCALVQVGVRTVLDEGPGLIKRQVTRCEAAAGHRARAIPRRSGHSVLRAEEYRVAVEPLRDRERPLLTPRPEVVRVP